MKIRNLVYQGQLTKAYLTTTSEWEKNYVLDHFSNSQIPLAHSFYRSERGEGYGYGDGDGCGEGGGWGDGEGDGDGTGEGNGDGNGNGGGYVNGGGYGNSYGLSSGRGSGNGNTYGFGSGQGNGWSGKGVPGLRVRGIPLSITGRVSSNNHPNLSKAAKAYRELVLTEMRDRVFSEMRDRED